MLIIEIPNRFRRSGALNLSIEIHCKGPDSYICMKKARNAKAWEETIISGQPV